MVLHMDLQMWCVRQAMHVKVRTVWVVWSMLCLAGLRVTLYATEWRQLDLPPPSNTALILGRHAPAQLEPQVVSSSMLHGVSTAFSMQRGPCDLDALCVVEAALALVQAQGALDPCSLTLATSGAARPISSTPGSEAHAGLWGLARSARAEAQLPVLCVDMPIANVVQPSLSCIEPEALVGPYIQLVPRLARAPITFHGPIRLNFHSRGAISSLYVESQPALSRPDVKQAQVTMAVRCVGLNFRDVLNVLGEYPGDPGPPGSDAAGVVCDAAISAYCRIGDDVFGIGQSVLASFSRAAPQLLALKPASLSFEQACTLPVSWSTTHTAVEKARLRCGQHLLIHAAAGGTGLKATEYAQWLGSGLLGSASRPHKHRTLRFAGVRRLCSSRNAQAFTFGVSRLLCRRRAHAALNSLSLDFISTSFAFISESGALEEIGKRSVWSLHRHTVSAPVVAYSVIAFDTDTSANVPRVHGVLQLLTCLT